MWTGQIFVKQNTTTYLLEVATLNVGAMREKPPEVVASWRRASGRSTTGKKDRYKSFWVGNNAGKGGVDIFSNCARKIILEVVIPITSSYGDKNIMEAF